MSTRSFGGFVVPVVGRCFFEAKEKVTPSYEHVTQTCSEEAIVLLCYASEASYHA